MASVPFRQVSVVCDPNFGKRLLAFDPSVPVWVVRSDINTLTANECRARGWRDVTTFNAESIDSLVATIFEHHPSCSRLHVHGVSLAEAIDRLYDGDSLFEKQEDGFIWHRQLFYIYKNSHRNRARLHKAECTRCSFGTWTPERDTAPPGLWRGPFNLNESHEETRRLVGEKCDVQPCNVCQP